MLFNNLEGNNSISNKSIRLPEENIGSEVFDIGLSSFFTYAFSGKGNKRKYKQMDHQMKKFLHRKRKHQQQQQQNNILRERKYL